MKKQKVLSVGILACAFGGIVPSFSMAAPRSFGARPPTFERTKPDKANRFSSEKTSLERLQRSQDESQILSAIGIQRDQMKSLIREFKIDNSESLSLQKLLSASHRSSSSKEDRALLKNYFQLLSHSTGEFHLTPSRLEHQLTTWSPFAKLQFAKVLETAVEFSKEGQSILREDAFEKALKKFDLDRDYRKQCRK